MEHVNCRWEVKTNKKNEFTEYRLHISFRETKRITIILALITGVLNVKGPSSKIWVQDVFRALKNLVLPAEEVTCKRPTKEKPSPPIVNVKSDSPTNKETNVEINNLWEENSSLRTAIRTLEADMCEKSKQQVGQAQLFETMIGDLKMKLDGVEKNYDSKLKVFLEAFEKSRNEKVEKVRRLCEDKIRKVTEKRLMKMRMSTRNRSQRRFITHPVMLQISRIK